MADQSSASLSKVGCDEHGDRPPRLFGQLSFALKRADQAIKEAFASTSRSGVCACAAGAWQSIR